jgi:hypothetical protein
LSKLYIIFSYKYSLSEKPNPRKIGDEMLKLRASKIGGCPRAYVLDIRKGEAEITSRQKIYFAVGKALEPVIMMGAGYDPAILFNDKVEVGVDIDDGLMITGHPDSATDTHVIECKTMRSFAWKKMVEHGLAVQFPQYLIQGSIYCKGLDKQGVIYLCLDKDASNIETIIVDWNTLEPFFLKAVETAKLIRRWVDKVRLPGRPAELPSWYCSKAYCHHVDCRNHYENPNRKSKPEWVKR